MLFCYSAFHCFHVWHVFGMIVLSRHSKHFVMWLKPRLRLVYEITHIPQPRHLHKGSLVWVIRLPHSWKTLSWLSDVAWKDLVLFSSPLQRNTSTAGNHLLFRETQHPAPNVMGITQCTALIWSHELQRGAATMMLPCSVPLVSTHISPQYSSIKAGWLLFRQQDIWIEHLKWAVWT